MPVDFADAPSAAAAVADTVASVQHGRPEFAADESVPLVAWLGAAIDWEDLELELLGQLPESELVTEPIEVDSAAVRTLHCSRGNCVS